jgi:hypothetical protein
MDSSVATRRSRILLPGLLHLHVSVVPLTDYLGTKVEYIIHKFQFRNLLNRPCFDAVENSTSCSRADQIVLVKRMWKRDRKRGHQQRLSFVLIYGHSSAVIHGELGCSSTGVVERTGPE